ncbi:hypothetical protein CEV33_3829 [Brucella grignonensis]|uniref:Uncharacterized protein n=1 Tax=Brucella grignonensis TaxID=94627 RepID=A0A256FRC3_9HYPH|nr:hypothetical protein CEV33_3829 [Brucella grignonensis]
MTPENNLNFGQTIPVDCPDQAIVIVGSCGLDPERIPKSGNRFSGCA